MVSFTIASFIGLAAIATAQTTSLPGATGAKAQSCDSAYTLCVSSYTSVDTCKAQQTACEASCAAKRATCGDAYNANQALCTAAETSCLGHLADAQAGNGGSAAAPGAQTTSTLYATVTVSSFETFCPLATNFVTNGVTYSATAGQTVTVTACPCVITTPVAGTGSTGTGNSGSGSGSGSGTAVTTGAVVTPNSSRSNTTATYTPVKYTGGASMIGAGLGAVAGAAGLLAFAL